MPKKRVNVTVRGEAGVTWMRRVMEGSGLKCRRSKGSVVCSDRVQIVTIKAR